MASYSDLILRGCEYISAPHPEERPLGRVSKDEAVPILMVRDAQCAKTMNRVGKAWTEATKRTSATSSRSCENRASRAGGLCPPRSGQSLKAARHRWR